MGLLTFLTIKVIDYISGLGTCPETTFRCQNKRCVFQSRVCDGNDDCGDSSDEIIGCSGKKSFKLITMFDVFKTANLKSLLICDMYFLRR